MTGEILVGVDRSLPSRAALRWSVERAQSLGMALRIIHVIDRPRENYDVPQITESRAQSWELVNSEVAFAHSLEPQIRIEGEVAEGSPVMELLAASQGAELVVVGTHKTGFIQGNLFGSKLLGLAAGAGKASAFIPEPSGAFRKGVVAGLDNSTIGREVIQFAAKEAARTSQELILISFLPETARRSASVNVASNFSKKSHSEQLAWGIHIARRDNPELRIRGRNASRPAAEALIRAATAAAVLIVGHSRSGPESPVMIGTVTLNVLLNISSPVIVLQGAAKLTELWRSSELSALSLL